MKMKAVIWRHSGDGGKPETTINELKGSWFVDAAMRLINLDEEDKDLLFQTVDFECWCEVELCLAHDADPLDPYFSLINFTRLT